MVAFAPTMLRQLTPCQRTVLEMYYLRRANHPEIAAWLGITERSVRYRLNEARARLGIRPQRQRKTHNRKITASQFSEVQIEIDAL